MNTVDTGMSTVDTGMSAVDTGMSTVDTGMITVDTGMNTVDTGMSTVDTGMSTVDTGPTGTILLTLVLADAFSGTAIPMKDSGLLQTGVLCRGFLVMFYAAR